MRRAGVADTWAARRRDLDPVLASAIFGVAAGEVAGPVRSDLGWHVILVEAHHSAQLDEATREAIADTLFAEWLDAERSKAEVRMPVLEF